MRGNPGRLPISDLFPHKWWQRWDIVTGFLPLQRTDVFNRKVFNRNELPGELSSCFIWTNYRGGLSSSSFFCRSNLQNFCVSVFLQFVLYKVCCSCPVMYLFFFVIFFFLLGGLQLTIVPDRPHWESNDRRKERQEATGKTGGGYGF